MVFGTMLIVLSVMLIGASFCFVTIQGLEVINIITNGTRQVGQYPMGIYKKGVRIFFSTVIPILDATCTISTKMFSLEFV